MNVSELFIRRPIATSLLMIGVLLTGLVGYKLLPVSALPQVDYPTIAVATTLPGASPDTMASSVTTPLERQFGQMPSLTGMTSVSSFAQSQITLQFDLTRDIDAAQQDVQAAINAAATFLPKTLPTPPIYSKSNPADFPILTLAVTSDTLPLSQVDDYADSILAQKIAQVPGVGLVSLGGGQKPAVRIQVDPEAIAGLGLGLEDVRSAIAAANVDQAKGNLDGVSQDYAMAADDQLFNAAAYKPIIVYYDGGAPVRVSDVATVYDGVENTQLAGWADDKRAVLLNVQRQPGANIIQVADKVKALLPRLADTIPMAVNVQVLIDRTETIRASVKDVQFTLILTVLLVVLVIFLFLRSLTATVIPSVAVPLSLVGTFGVMYLVGYSLDNLSLMALTISTGFVVDDAIVMIENIDRFIEEGHPPFEAALLGAKQIGFTIISLTVSLVAVLIPLLFMGGIIGRLFREFAVTLSVAIVVSAILSLTLTPMMCAHLLRPKGAQHGRLYRVSERFFEWLIRGYEKGLKVVLRHQPLVLAITIGTLIVTIILFWTIPKGFFPLQDTGMLQGVTEAPPDISFPEMMVRQEALVDVVRADPDVQSVASFIGSDGTNPTTNSGRLSITLKSRDERSTGAPEIVRRLLRQATVVQGIDLYLQQVQDLQVDNRVSRTQYQYTLEDANPGELAMWGPKLLDKLKTLPMLRDVASDQQSAGLQASLRIDRDTASRLGVTTQAIDDTLYDAFGQRQISIIFTQLNQYRVILEVKPEFQRDPNALDRIYVRSVSGSEIPLSAFTRFEQTVTPLSINHQGQFPAVTLSFNLAPGEALGGAVDGIRKAGTEIELPSSVHAEFAGTAQAFQDSLKSEPILVLAALITVYIVLGILYESTIHPITILSTLPSAGIGALLMLMITGNEFSVIALIGIVLLIGIVKKNAIMMIDFALEAERVEKLPPEESILKACLLRFRPIMMTTMAALLGGVPLALGTGTGSELRRPLGISIVGGLIISQLLTLFTTPVVYLYMDRLATWLHRFKTPGAQAAEPEKPRGSGVSPQDKSVDKPEEKPSPDPKQAAAPGGPLVNQGQVSFSEPFIRRPVATSLLALAILLAGAAAYQLLPVSPLPRVDFPTLNVNGALPGADPETMASSVATPLERRAGRIAGLAEMTSTSSLGASSLTLQFDLDRNVDDAARDVQAAINAAAGELPTDLPSLPTYRKVNPSDSPILLLSMTSETLPLGEVYDAANSILAQKISQVDGVGQVTVSGGQQPAVRVQVDPAALAGLGLSLEDVRTFLASVSVDESEGSLTGARQTSQIAANDQIFGAAAYRNLVFTYRTGAPVRLSDIANVVDGPENNRLAAWSDGKRAILMIIRRAPGANIISTIERIQRLLPVLSQSISPAIDVRVVMDRTQTIRASVRDVERTLLITIALVVMVVFLFLRRVWATVIPSVAVPLSLVGTFGVMYLCDYSIDNLSLMALTISTGFVVDDAIVMIENITRFIELGHPPFEAALLGAKQIGFTIVSITVSLIAVFTPILLMGGLVGRLFREFAVTLSVAIAVSALVSLTLTPMLCARFLRSERGKKEGRVGQVLERLFNGLHNGYEHGLKFVLRHRFLTLCVAIGTLVVTVLLYIVVPKGFFPQQDNGLLAGFSEASQDISFPAMKERQMAINAVVQQDQAIDHVNSFIGSSNGSAGNTGFVFIALKPLADREGHVTADQIINRLRPRLAKVEGITLYLQAVQDVRVGGRTTRTQYQYAVEDADLAELNQWAPKLVERLKKVPALRDVATDQQTAGLQARLHIDRDTASRLGVSAQLIDNILYDAFGQRQVATTYTQLNQYHVILEVKPELQLNPDALNAIYVPTPNDGQVPLSTFTHVEPTGTSLSVNHQGQFPAVTLSFNLAPGVSLGDAVVAINAAEQDIRLPGSIHASFQGTAQAFQASLKSEPMLILAALMTVYIVLGVLYESLIHPITILSTLPSAGVGALLMLMVTKTEFSIIALIGIILLIGIVKKNAIMMIDFALEAERVEGLSPIDSIYKACMLRFRPIMMTTMAALLGGLPLALGTGTGSELRRPLGISIVGGLIISQMLTLFTTPVVYLYLDRFSPRRRKSPAPDGKAVASAIVG